MREHTCTFIGHRECFGLKAEQVRTALESLISQGVTEFLCGGMGEFDWLCARQVYLLKKEYPCLHSELVIPYLSFHVLEPSYFDTILYPEGMERYQFKSAIPARNQYLVEHSAYALCYVTHHWGGAAQTYKLAKRRGLLLVHLSVI